MNEVMKTILERQTIRSYKPEQITDEQLELLKDLGWSRKRDADYQKHKALLNDTVLACEYAVSDYLRQTIIMAKTRHPKNLFLYVKKMVESDGD